MSETPTSSGNGGSTPSPTLPFGGIPIDQLPLTLAGPILKRVEYDYISLWIVFREFPSDMQLRVYRNFAEPIGSQNPTWVSEIGDYEVVTIGTHVHVALIKIEIPEGEPMLNPREICHYDLWADFPGIGGKRFNSPGMLARAGQYPTPGLISYGSATLPSFSAPASDLDHLRVVHGSCRKAHGGGKDGLTFLDKMLSDNRDQPDFRPQQLFLTGDQVYGDDVADAMAAMIQETMSLLMGYDETLPGIPANELHFLGIGSRTPLVVGQLPNENDPPMQASAGFTGYGAYSKNHSMKLAEYVGLYLFGWADVLWPPAIPDFVTARSNSDEDVYVEEVPKLEIFRQYLPEARRALANIPAYMMFDDHDVTDDWFLHREGSESAMASELGRRIMSNALTAFALFQSWGNSRNEAVTTATKRADIHRLAGEVYELAATSSPGADGKRIELEQILLPTPPTQTPGPGQSEYDMTGGMDWHFTLQFSRYQVIFLNTRTNRAFFGDEGRTPPGLINMTSLDAQLPEPSSPPELTFVVAPAPVFGFPFIEDVVQKKGAQMQEFLYEQGKRQEPGSSFFDLEAWKFFRSTYEILLQRLSEYNRVVLLSGDVHYAFSAEIKYWDQRNATEHRAKFAQLTSSSLKNEDNNTRRLNGLWVNDRAYIGWDTPGVLFRGGKSGDVPRVSSGGTKVLELEEEIRIVTPPRWQYEVDYKKDTFFSIFRGQIDYPHTDRSYGEEFQEFIANLSLPDLKRIFLNTRGREIMGTTNIGLVTIDWPISGPKVLKHYLWTHVKNFQNSSIPLTQHAISLDIPAASDPRPASAYPTDPTP